MKTIQDIEQRVLGYAGSVKISGGINRVGYFLEQLGNPQHSYQVIHIAGTSGKGTTCWMMSHCLHTLGYRVGLTMSPHVLDVRERCMIDGKLLDEELFVNYMNFIKNIIDTTDWSDVGQPSYFEIMIVAALYIFAQEKLDYVILETGLGGRLDATNIVNSPDKICVITSIGYDHQKFLGDTLDLIATEKTMIVHPGNHCFGYHQDTIIDATIEQVVQEQGGTLHRVGNDHYSLPGDFVGQHNQRNMSVVNGVLQYLYEIGSIDRAIDVVELMNNCPPLLARMQDIKTGTNTFIIDGAHNTQKMSAMIQGLGEKFGVNQKYVFILAFKEDKNVGEVLEIILPHASRIICTEFGQIQQDYLLRPVNVDTIKQICIEQGFDDVYVELDHQKIIDGLLKNEIVVVTGSFFLASSFIKLLS